MELSYTYTPDYKAIIKDYLAGLEKLAKFKQWNTERARVIKEMTEAHEQLTAKFEAFRQSKISEYSQQMATIEVRHKNAKGVYKDPQMEMLRRQDFDLEFETWDINDAIHYLRDEIKTFSRYELAKIRNTFRGDSRIETLLAQRQEDAELAFALDPEYKKLNEMVSILTMTRSVGLSIVYLPADNEDGFEVLDLTLDNIDKNLTVITSEHNRISELLSKVPNEQKGDWEQLKGLVEVDKQKKMAFEEFDERIFRGAETFDPTVRFQYLKERFDDTSNDVWTLDNPSYDVLAHSRFLERQHDLKLANDPTYAERYRLAEIAATYEQGRTDSEN